MPNLTVSADIDALMGAATKGAARAALQVEGRTARGDAIYTILATDKMVVLTAALTAARIWTLPAANTVPAGYELIIDDEFGGVSATNTLTLARAGADTIDGATSEVIAAPYAMRRMFSNGTDRWSFDKGVLRNSMNLSDLLDVPTARVNLGIDARRTFSKAAITVALNDTYVAQTGTYTPGTDTPGATAVNLPQASTVKVGHRVVVADESGSIRPWYRLMLTPFAGDRINNVVNDTYPMIWGSQAVELMCTGAGWVVLYDNVKPTEGLMEQRGMGPGMVCIENDMALMSGNGTQPGFRPSNSGTTINGGGGNTSMTTAVLLSGTSAGQYSAAFGTTIVSGGMAQSVRKGQWVEHLVTSFEAIDATNDAIVRLGAHDTPASSSDVSNGAWLMIDRTVSATNWVMCTANGATRTKTATSIAFGTGITRIGVEWDDTQTACYYFVNDTYAGSVTLNVPSASRVITLQAGIAWVLGASRAMGLDRWRHQFRAVIGRAY